MPAWLRVIGAVGSPLFNWKVVRGDVVSDRRTVNNR